MLDAFQVVKLSFKDFWEEFVLLVVLNLLWAAAVALPIAPLFLLGTNNLLWALALGLLLLIPLPVISGALCFVTNQISRGKAVGWGTFLAGIRHFWAKSLVVGVINLVALILLATNLQFYGRTLEGTWTNLVLSLWILVVFYWLLVQVFWFPMVLELESEQVFLALRNALALAIITPSFSLTLALLLGIVIALCLVLTIPVLLFMASFILLVSNHATRSRLAVARKEAHDPGHQPDKKTEPQD